MPTRTLVQPRKPAAFTRITAEKGKNVSLVFVYKWKNGSRSEAHNYVHGLVHRSNGSYGIINEHGVRIGEVPAFFDLVMVDGDTDVSAWGR